MSFPNRDAQILAHILEYCNRIERTLSRFGKDFDVFLEDQDYMDSVSMNLLQIGELAGKFSDAYVQKEYAQYVCARLWFDGQRSHLADGNRGCSGTQGVLRTRIDRGF
mgnify:CR=1 FL=1